MELVDPLFNLHKIKFEMLDKWGLVNKQTTNAVVYINLDNVFKIIMTPRVNNFVQASASVEGYEECTRRYSRDIVSNIINLGQHYRLWFAKQGIDCKVILYWNYPISEKYRNSKYLATYRAEYNKKYSMNMENSHFLSILNEAVKFCKECINYINEVYLISIPEIDASMIPFILDKEIYKDQENVKKFIVSNSICEFPYVNYGFTILSPSIRKKQPYFVNKTNVIEVIKSRYKVNSLLTVDSNFLEFMNAILGEHDRGIPSLTGVGIVSIMKLIHRAIDNGIITENTKDVSMLSTIIKEDFRDIFIRNYQCTSLECQMNDIEPLDVHRIVSLLVDNYDENTLREMNEKYFKLCPIEIIRPKSEQVLYDNSSNKSIFDR